MEGIKKKKQKINISIVLQAFDKNTSIEDKIEPIFTARKVIIWPKVWAQVPIPETQVNN